MLQLQHARQPFHPTLAHRQPGSDGCWLVGQSTVGAHSKGGCPGAQDIGHDWPRVAMQPPGSQHHQVGQSSQRQTHVQVHKLRLFQHSRIRSFLAAAQKDSLDSPAMLTRKLSQAIQHTCLPLGEECNWGAESVVLLPPISRSINSRVNTPLWQVEICSR